MKIAALAGAFICLILATPLYAQEMVSHGRFKDVSLYRPRGEVKEFVLLLSGDGGWDEDATAMAQALVDQHAMVAGISLPQFLTGFEKDADTCVFPDGDLENLSHYLQGYARLPVYFTPLLVGHSSGAALAYAVIAQAPANTFTGAISLGFCPNIPMNKPMCGGDGFRYIPSKNGGGMDLLPVKKLRVPWVMLQGEQDQICNVNIARAFISKSSNSEMILLPKTGHNISRTAEWMPEYIAAFNKMSARRAAATPAISGTLSDLPIVEVSSNGDSDTFAVLLSGDGGWAGIDKDIAAALAEKGVPVTGLDTLRYFWSTRTPEGLTADLDRILRYYAGHWKKSRVILIGYSQGANVLPFAINRLAADTRSMVGQSVLMGLRGKASFEFHLGNWFGGESGGVPVLPEAIKLSAESTLCIYGEDEEDSLCPGIPAGHVRSLSLPGGHHFDGDYDRLAELILAWSRKPEAQ
ncbi:MAG: AcvB/VirJ family lysyl-phosphatidylglycerol hydrolase [Alphaproteobacteria bacterium]